MELRSDLQIFNDKNPLLLKKRIRLLEMIDKTGSIKKAAQEVPLSYKAAWESVDVMNNLSPKLLVESSGSKKGGSMLSEYGRSIVYIYKKVAALQDEFLSKLSESINLQSGELETLQRMTMQISARNRLSGTIGEIKEGAVNAEVSIRLKGEERIAATITKDSLQEMELAEGREAVAIFKASSVILMRAEKGVLTSARNRLEGTITKLETGAVNTEVVIALSGGESISSIITKDAAQELGLGIGDGMTALIKATNIIVGV